MCLLRCIFGREKRGGESVLAPCCCSYWLLKSATLAPSRRGPTKRHIWAIISGKADEQEPRRGFLSVSGSSSNSFSTSFIECNTQRNSAPENSFFFRDSNPLPNRMVEATNRQVHQSLFFKNPKAAESLMRPFEPSDATGYQSTQHCHGCHHTTHH